MLGISFITDFERRGELSMFTFSSGSLVDPKTWGRFFSKQSGSARPWTELDSWHPSPESPRAQGGWPQAPGDDVLFGKTTPRLPLEFGKVEIS